MGAHAIEWNGTTLGEYSKISLQRYFCHWINSQANGASLLDYVSRFKQADLYDRMFFVWHTGNVSANAEAEGITLISPERLARMCLDAGLASWLREKVS